MAEQYGEQDRAAASATGVTHGWIPIEPVEPSESDQVELSGAPVRLLSVVKDGRSSIQQCLQENRAEMERFREPADLADAVEQTAEIKVQLLKRFIDGATSSIEGIFAGHDKLAADAKQNVTGRPERFLELVSGPKLEMDDSGARRPVPGTWQWDPRTARLLKHDLALANDSVRFLERKFWFKRRAKNSATAACRQIWGYIRPAERQLADLKEEHAEASRAAEAARHDLADCSERCASRLRELLDLFGSSLESERAILGAALEKAPFWSRPGWEFVDGDEWEPPAQMGRMYVANVSLEPDPDLGEYADLGCGIGYPLIVDPRHLHGMQYVYGSTAERTLAESAARGLMVRLLAGSPPGKTRLTIFDPLGLGQAVAPLLRLADFDPLLISGKVWSTNNDLVDRLQELIAHIEMVTQKYLRGEYHDIDEFNLRAGEIAEPYRFLFCFDFPNGFDESSYQLFCRVIENGPRCGVFTVTTIDTTANFPYGVDLSRLPRLPKLSMSGPVELEGIGEVPVEPDTDPATAVGGPIGQEIIDQVVDRIGRQGRGADEITVNFTRTLALYNEIAQQGIRSDIPVLDGKVDFDDPATWWRTDSTEAVVTPLGQSGAKDVAVLRFDSEILSGALLVGRPGSGKSTLLHTSVAGLTTLYSPQELEMFLIDFKEGVEFKGYAEHRLPHARCVAVESEREFGLSVLEAIVAEMHRRGALLRETGGEQTTFASYRKVGPERLARMLLVFDEFQVLFAHDDPIGSKAADLLETVIRQGRGFGVHVLLASQSLSGMDALGRHVLQLLPVRILLPSSDSDAQTVLGEGNDAGRFLSRRGEAVVNPQGGAPEANSRFQTAFVNEETRLSHLLRLQQLATEQGWDRVPVVFEGRAAAAIDTESPESFVSSLDSTQRGVTLRIGNPVSLAGPVSVNLRREAAANMVIVHKGSHDIANTLTALVALSAVIDGCRCQIIDFTAIDDGLEDSLAVFLERGVLTVSRRRQAADVMAQLAAQVAQRIESEDYRAEPVLLMMHGVHRARDLDPDAGYGADPSEYGPDMATSLRTLLHDGPEVGIHTVLWVDTVANLERRLDRQLMRDVGFIIAGPMGRDDSTALLDTDQATRCKDFQLVVAEEDSGRQERAIAYDAPDQKWLAAVLDQKRPSP